MSRCEPCAMTLSTKRKLTRDEIRNGWTEQKLAAYLAEREAQQAVFADQPKPKRVIVENVKTSFNPHKWDI
jgi:hypothetical protein